MPSQQTASMTEKRLNELLKDANLRCLGPDTPVVEEFKGVNDVRLLPKPSQIVFEIIGGCQRSIEFECFVQTAMFILGRIQSLRVLE